MVPDRQKVWTDGRNGRTDDAKTISLRLCWGIIRNSTTMLLRKEVVIYWLIQHFEVDFLWKVSLKIVNPEIILKTFTDVVM